MILADRLGAIVPDGFDVRAEEGTLWYTAAAERFPGQSGNYLGGGAVTDVGVNFSAGGSTDQERLVWVAKLVLDDLQDVVDEQTHDPWPGDTTPPSAYAQICDSMLHLWYGGTDEVVLACDRYRLPTSGSSPDAAGHEVAGMAPAVSSSSSYRAQPGRSVHGLPLFSSAAKAARLAITSAT